MNYLAMGTLGSKPEHNITYRLMSPEGRAVAFCVAAGVALLMLVYLSFEEVKVGKGTCG